MNKTHNRVWIEIEPHDDEAVCKQRAELATNMLRRLSERDDPDRNKFFWSAHEHRYCYGGPMGYVSLSDNGQWFNLNYLGRAK